MEIYQYMKTPVRFSLPRYRRNTTYQALYTTDLYIKILKGMYGLKKAGIIAFRILVKNLTPHGYHPVKYTPCLWSHKIRNSMFTLVVDDFGIK